MKFLPEHQLQHGVALALKALLDLIKNDQGRTTIGGGGRPETKNERTRTGEYMVSTGWCHSPARPPDLTSFEVIDIRLIQPEALKACKANIRE